MSKIKISFAILILIASVFFFAPTQNTDAQVADVIDAILRAAMPVNIPDANLRSAIESALGKAAGVTITRGEMATLTELNVGNQGITDLTGLEFATGLTELVLTGNSLTE